MFLFSSFLEYVRLTEKFEKPARMNMKKSSTRIRYMIFHDNE